MKKLVDMDSEATDLTSEDLFDTVENSDLRSIDSFDSGDEKSADQIKQFISNIRERVTNEKNLKRHSQVEIEDLEPEENNAGVNPLPVDCPLLLVDLRRVKSTRTKRADLQQICNRSVLTKTDQLQTNLSSAESVFSLLQMLSLNTLRDFKTADEKHTNNRSADYLLRLQMICNTMKSKYRIDIPFIVSRLRYKP